MKRSLKTENQWLQKDLEIVLKLMLKDDPREKVQEWIRLNDLVITVSDSKSGTDGDCFLYFDNKKKSMKITLTKKVMRSKFICWRLSILLHEICHFLQFRKEEVTKDNLIPEHEHHGLAWRQIVQESISRGNLKDSAFLERSTKPKCLFSRHCKWCSTKNSRMSVSVEKLYQPPKVTKFKGVCEFCDAPGAIRLIPHIQSSQSCFESYNLEYGVNWHGVTKSNHAILQRRKKRPNTKESVCEHCETSNDSSLPNHLEYHLVCRNQYMKDCKVTKFEDLKKILHRERKRINKKNSRAKSTKK